MPLIVDFPPVVVEASVEAVQVPANVATVQLSVTRAPLELEADVVAEAV